MSRLDNSGRYLLSGLAREVSLLEHGKEPRILSKRGTVASWFDAYARVAIWQDMTGPADVIVTMGISDEQATVLEPQGCNGLAAGGGRFTAFRSGPGATAIFGHIPPGINAQRAALAPDWSIDGRAPMGRDGTLAFVADYKSSGPLLLHAKGAPDTVIASAQSPYGLHILGPDRATWNGGALGVDISGRFPGAAWGIPLERPDGLWWADYIEGRGFCVYKSGMTMGFLVAREAWAPDAIVTADGQIVVGYSTGAGELPHEARIVALSDLAMIRLDTPIVVVEPPAGGGGTGTPTGGGTPTTPTEPKEPQELTDMRVIDGAVFDANWIPAATSFAKELYPDVPDAEIAQSIREESDRIRGGGVQDVNKGRNATIWELLNSPARRVRVLPKALTAQEQDAFFVRVKETEGRLRR